MFATEQTPGHLVIIRSLEPGEEWVDYLLDLLVRHRPGWALETAVRLRGNRPELELNVEGLVSLDTIDFPDHYDRARGVWRLQSILEALDAAQDALVELDQIMVGAGQIFFDPVTSRVKLAVIPTSGSIESRPDFTSDFRLLLTSMQKAYNLEPALVEKLGRRAECNNLSGIQLGSSEFGDSSSHSDQPQAGISGGPTGEQVKSQQLQRLALLPLLLAAGHLLILAGLTAPIILTRIKPVAQVVNAAITTSQFILYYRVLGSVAVLLLIIDLVISGLAHCLPAYLQSSCARCRNLFSSIIQKLSKASISPQPGKTGTNKLSPAEPANQTVRLTPSHEAYRLGLLSVGLPGSPEETEGLRAYILVDEFLIGRDESFCDLPLSSAAAGRRHARIVRREGSFFITDLGSKNGTSLDGRRLNKLEEYLLPDRCRLEFADLAFYFSAD